MSSNRIRIAALLLVFAHCSHTFVLLTANIEDVKKIARKFVSEALAQQIADFIAKAAAGQQQTNANVSAENEQNVDKVDAISDNEIPRNKILRQGSHKQTRSTRETRFQPEENRDQALRISKQKYMRETEKQARGPMTDRDEEYNKPKSDPYSKLLSGEQMRQHKKIQKQLEMRIMKQKEQQNREPKYAQQQETGNIQRQQKKRHPKYDETPQYENQKYNIQYQNEPNYDQQNMRQKSIGQQNEHYQDAQEEQGSNQAENESQRQEEYNYETTTVASQYLGEEGPREEAENFRMENQQAELNEQDVNNADENPVDNEQVEYEPSERQRTNENKREQYIMEDETPEPQMQVESSRYPAFNIAQQLTTEKEKNEFDDYDNMQARALVATSGPVALKAVDPWWQKALPQTGTQNNNVQVAPVHSRPLLRLRTSNLSTIVFNLDDITMIPATLTGPVT